MQQYQTGLKSYSNVLLAANFSRRQKYNLWAWLLFLQFVNETDSRFADTLLLRIRCHVKTFSSFSILFNQKICIQSETTAQGFHLFHCNKCPGSLSKSASVSGGYSNSGRWSLLKTSRTFSTSTRRMESCLLMICVVFWLSFKESTVPPRKMLRLSSIVWNISTSSQEGASILKPSSDISSETLTDLSLLG